MKKNKSIKIRITFWYTLIITLVLGIALGGVFLASERYSMTGMKEELIDEVSDLEEDILSFPDYFPGSDLMPYYDDGILLSVYDSEGKFINGIVPDRFPIEQPFVNKKVNTVSNDLDRWYVYDKVIVWKDDSVYWIRGINSYSSIAQMVDVLRKWVLILIPALIFFTAFIGYMMISRSLRPVQKMTDRVNEIKASSDLSLRLPRPPAGDELSYIADTFNDLLETLQDQFVREKQFSSDAAHELRTPISVILSHCEYMLEDMDLDEEQREEVSIIYDKSRHMSELIDALLMISRTEKKNYRINMDDIDLSMLAESIVDDMSPTAAQKNITIKLSDHLEDPQYTGDMTLMVRLFSNMISNSIKYGKDNGHILIQMREENGLIHLLFEDDGIGIPKDSIDRIWDRFYQVEDSRAKDRGFGLGLFMVKRIVQLHKGGIEVSSTFGVGTRFAVTLPRLSGPEEEQAQQEEQQEPENKKNQEQTQQKEDKQTWDKK
ncbi:MAG: HAMP domain-containing sensor histidine kinase [Anaerovoracaceae bacterium]|nr:HAMP domain-containing sensor histidine kinase [Anaerovoracaceae bacterium]